MNWLHFGVARGGKFPFIVGALGLLWMLHGVGSESFYRLDTPRDDRNLRRSLMGRPELQPAAAALDDVVSGRLCALDDAEIEKIFGPRLVQRPPNLELPIFDVAGRYVPGPSASVMPGRIRVDLRAVGDAGYVEFYFTWDGIVSSAAFYNQADSGFVPLRSEADLPKRLQWDAEKFVRISQWLNQHLPPSTDLGAVMVTDRQPSPLHIGDGKDGQVEARLESATSFWAILTVNSQKQGGEVGQTTFVRKIQHPDEPFGFALDGQFFHFTPKLKNPPTVTDLGVVRMSRYSPTPLNVGPDRECIASVHHNPGGFTAIDLEITCKTYREMVLRPAPFPGHSISFPIDGNIVVFTPDLENF